MMWESCASSIRVMLSPFLMVIDDWTFLGNVSQKPPIAVDSRGQAAQVSQGSSGGRFLVDPNQLSAAYTQFFVATGKTCKES